VKNFLRFSSSLLLSAMLNLIDLCPEFNDETLKWDVRETDEKDNTLEVYSFDTEEEAENFVDKWIEKH
jgi:hypothetical protein